MPNYYFQLFDWVFIGCAILFVITYLPKLIYYCKGIFSNQSKNYLKTAEANHKFAVIIPARNESKVIKGLLDSLEKQTYPADKFDIYVAVERRDDPTVDICADYPNVEVFYKQDLSRIGKGYVLEEVFDYILKEKQQAGYEAFMVFDADNLVCKTFIEEMNKAFDMGYDFAVGNRNTKNWNDGWIASCTGLTFVKFSRFQNYGRSKSGKGALISGTGFYVSKKVIDEFGGWKWFSLTEDYELTVNCALHGYTAMYCNKATFYDEQPSNFKVSFTQRVRWIKGFFMTGSKYGKQLRKGLWGKESKSNKGGCYENIMGAVPLIALAGGLIVYTLAMSVGAVLYSFIDMQMCYLALMRLGLGLGAYYLLMVLDATLMLTLERKRLNISVWNTIKAILLHPVFSAMYLAVVIASLFQKPIWKPIEHKVNIEFEG